MQEVKGRGKEGDDGIDWTYLEQTICLCVCVCLVVTSQSLFSLYLSSTCPFMKELFCVPIFMRVLCVSSAAVAYLDMSSKDAMFFFSHVNLKEWNLSLTAACFPLKNKLILLFLKITLAKNFWFLVLMCV